MPIIEFYRKGENMGKIFVRERIKVGKGEGKPRFAVVAVQGIDLKVYHTHLRRAELEKLAEDVSAELVYLPRGENAAEETGQDDRPHQGRRRRRAKGEQKG
jgi:hypothetical protein